MKEVFFRASYHRFIIPRLTHLTMVHDIVGDGLVVSCCVDLVRIVLGWISHVVQAN